MSDHNTPTENKAHHTALVRYGLAILLSAFLLREAVYMTATPYPGWLLFIVFLSVLTLMIPFEKLVSPT